MIELIDKELRNPFGSHFSVDLDATGILHGLDKSSLRGGGAYRGSIPCSWDYLRHYESLFHEFKHADFNFIEIGVMGGSSISVWLEYFSRATIVGVDIQPDCAVFSRGRAIVEIGSQDDADFLYSVADRYPPHIVIDDGSHFAAHIIKSFEILFPRVAPGGLYIVEDAALHFAFDGRAIKPIQNRPDFPSEPIYDYFSRLIMAKLAHFSTLGSLELIAAEIDEIRVVGGMLVIRKRYPRDIDGTFKQLMRQLDQLACQSREKYAHGCSRIAEFIVTYGLDPQIAMRYAGEAAKLTPQSPYALQVLYLVQSTTGDSQAAEQTETKLKELGVPKDLAPCAKPQHMAYPHF